jgi:hypothetical protein
MGTFSRDELRVLSDAMIEADFHRRREVLRQGINKKYWDSIRVMDSPIDQLEVDLGHLNETPPLSDGSWPIAQWLDNIDALANGMTVGQIAKQMGAKLPKEPAVPAPPNGDPTPTWPWPELLRMLAASLSIVVSIVVWSLACIPVAANVALELLLALGLALLGSTAARLIHRTISRRRSKPTSPGWKLDVAIGVPISLAAGVGLVVYNPPSPSCLEVEMIAVPGGAFRLSKTEVTQALWEEIMGAQSIAENDAEHYLRGDQYPVAFVSWTEALEFTNALSRAAGLRPCYEQTEQGWTARPRCRGYRLPTAEEWDSVVSDEYPSEPNCTSANLADRSLAKDEALWEELVQDIPDFRNKLAKCEDGFPSLAPVGSLHADEFGFHDLEGNVAEWVVHEARSGQLEPRIRGTTFRGPNRRGDFDYDEARSSAERRAEIGIRLAQRQGLI